MINSIHDIIPLVTEVIIPFLVGVYYDLRDLIYVLYFRTPAHNEEYYTTWMYHRRAFRRLFRYFYMSPEQLKEYAELLTAARFIGAGLSTIGVIGAGIGIGQIFAGFLLAYARNPHLRNAFFGYVLLGFALCEAIALFALMMAFLILFM